MVCVTNNECQESRLIRSHQSRACLQKVCRARESWADKSAYDTTAKKLAGLFNKNFETYAAGASDEVKAAAPVV